MHVRFVPRAPVLGFFKDNNITMKIKSPDSVLDGEVPTRRRNEILHPTSVLEFRNSIKKDELRLEVLDGALARGSISLEEYTTLLREYSLRLELQKKRLEEKVGIDPLTGIPNITFMNSTIDGMIKELNYGEDMRKSGMSAIVVVTIDLKGLKEFNKYDQQVGDQALQAFAMRIDDVAARKNDKVFRIGGDEFRIVISLHNTSPDFDFSKRLQELKNDIEKDLSIDAEFLDGDGNKNNKTLPLETYMGYATLNKGDTKTKEDLLKESAANMALVKATTKLSNIK